MLEIVNIDRLRQVLDSVKTGEEEPETVVQTVSSVIQHNLALFKASATIENAGQVANILSAYLFPEKVLSKAFLKRIDSGWLPEFSSSEPEQHALERGIAIVAINTRQTLYEDVGLQLMKVLAAQGHFPKSEDVREYQR